MKSIKKITAALICFAMIMTMLPLSVFASSGNRPTDPDLIAEEDKFTDPDYDFERYLDLEGDDNGVHFEWNHETKTLYVNGIKPEATLYRFFFGFYKFYLFDEEELEAVAEAGSNEVGTWDEIPFVTKYVEHIIIGENITVIKNLDFNTDEMPDLKDITAVDGHPGITVISSPKILGGDYEVSIPFVNISIGSRAYANKTLESVVLPPSVSDIGKECFCDADIKLIDLSQTNITVIPEKCFYAVKNLETVLLPPCIERIEDNAFTYSEIEYITLPSAVVYVGKNTFGGCAKLQSANLKNINVKKLSGTFSGCVSLSEVQLPPMLESMVNIFNNCSSLTEFNIPEGVTELTGLSGTHFDLSDLPKGLKILGNIGDTGFEIMDLREFDGLKINASSCAGNQTLKEVYFPLNDFDAIDDNTFKGCSNLEKVEMYSCTSIGHLAFAGTNLTQIEISDNCSQIDSDAFKNCHNLTYVRLPMDLSIITSRITDGITTVNPFSGCENLETVIYPSKNRFQYNSRNNKYSTVANKLYRSGFLTNENLTVYLYPDTDIEQYCKDYGINYEYIDWDLERNTDVEPSEDIVVKEFTKEGKIGNGTFSINEYGYNGFSSSRSLLIYAKGELATTEMTCSNGTKTDIAEIMNHYNMKNIFFLDSTTSIAQGLFENYSEKGKVLRSIYFHPAVTKIGDNAFRNCGAHDVYFSNGKTTVGGYTRTYEYGNGISDIGKYAFADNEYLLCLNIKSTKLTEIKEGTFYNTAICQTEQHATYGVFKMPSGVKKIGKKAFGAFNRGHIWISDEPVGTDTELHLQQREMRIGTGDGTAVTTANMVTGPFRFVIPNTITDIYYDPEHPEDNAIGVKANGYADEWIILDVAKPSAAYEYAKLFGLRYRITEGWETDEEMVAPPTYDITDPELITTPPITGIISTDEMIAEGTNSNMKWSYQPQTKTMTLSSTLGSYFNSRNLYYSDGSKVEEGDFEVDNLVISGSFKQILGAKYLVHRAYGGDYYEYNPTPISFFNPKNIIFSSNNITTIYDEAFKDCTRLESIIIPGSIKGLGENLFENTPSLKRAIFEDGITAINQGMFENHKGLQFVELPETLETISANAFKGCTSLQEINIPDSCIAIGMNAFKSDVDVLSVTLGSGLNQIGKDAFSDLLYCEKITVKTDKIRTDSSVIGIDYRDIFANLGKLTDGITVDYADGLGTADFKVFDDKKVTKIVLGADISLLKNADCLGALKKIELSADNESFYLNDEALYTSNNILVLVPRTADSFTIAQGCRGIGENAFYGAELETISVPGSVKKIGDYAFANAKNLKTVSLNKGCEEIGDGAFENCDKLRFIFTPANMALIGEGAFRSCDKLSTVILNDELQSIGAMAFAQCSALRGIVIPEHVETIGAMAFADCSALEYAYIWDAVPVGSEVFLNDLHTRIYTVIGSNTYVWARAYSIPYVSYLDEDAFYTETMLRLDVEAGYLGYCEGEHGAVVWLTVCEADCEHEGYRIGVCEYCSELLEEEHIPAIGHDYEFVTNIPQTATCNSVNIYRCNNCAQTYSTYAENTGEEFAEMQTVSGKVVFADDSSASSGTFAVKGVAVQLSGVTIAKTDENGDFSAFLQSGSYNLVLHYAYGFDRTISIDVKNENVNCGVIPILGCDFTKDGAIDNADNELMRILLFAREGDASYIEYADFNRDGIIDSTDYEILINCSNIDFETYHYPDLIV